jgi:hypothetical protein
MVGRVAAGARDAPLRNEGEMKCINCKKSHEPESMVIYCAKCDVDNQGNALEVQACHAEFSVIDDTLDMVNAPQCGDPFMSPRITRIQMLATQRNKAEAERDQLCSLLGNIVVHFGNGEIGYDTDLNALIKDARQVLIDCDVKHKRA